MIHKFISGHYRLQTFQQDIIAGYIYIYFFLGVFRRGKTCNKPGVKKWMENHPL